MKISLLTAAVFVLPFGSYPSIAQSSCIPPSAQSTALKGSSPLLTQEQFLLQAPPEVQYEFLRQVYPRLGMTRGEFFNLPASQANVAVSEGYYLAAIQKAALVTRGDAELVAILETITSGASPQAAVKSFDRRFKQKFGTWAPIVPVDVDALINRMLGQRTIR